MGQQDSISPFQRGSSPLRLLALALVGASLLAARPAHAVEWQTYLKEDFSEEKSMFYTGQAGEAFYRIDPDGRYIVDGLETASDSLSALTDKLYYYYAEASCQVLESSAGDLAFCGLIFHYHKTGDGQLAYYVFYTYGDGYYGAKRVEGEQSDIIIPLAKSTMVNATGGNILGVDAQGSRFDLYINGKYVDGFTDTGVDGGGFGFYVSKHSLGAFDDFIVRIEKRGTGKEMPEAPSIAEGGEGTAKDYFDGYHPPEIPKDPERPLYPWEVGYDKSQKAKKHKAEGGEGKSAKAPEQKGPKESRPGAEREKKKESGSAPAADDSPGQAGESKESRPAQTEAERSEPVPSEHAREKEARPGSKAGAAPPTPPAEDAALPADETAPPVADSAPPGAEAGTDDLTARDEEAAAKEDSGTAAVPGEETPTQAGDAPGRAAETPVALDAGAPADAAAADHPAERPEVEAAPEQQPEAANFEKPSANPDGSLAPAQRAEGDVSPVAAGTRDTGKSSKAKKPAGKEGEAPPPAKEKAKRKGINLKEDDWENQRATPVQPAARPAKAEPDATPAPAKAEAEPVVRAPESTETGAREPSAAEPAPQEEPLPAAEKALPEAAEPASGTALSELAAKTSAAGPIEATPDSQARPEAPPESQPTPAADSVQAEAKGGGEAGASREAASQPGADPSANAPETAGPALTEGASAEAAAAGPEAADSPGESAADGGGGPPANPYYGGAAEDTPLSELMPEYQPPSDTPLSALLGEHGAGNMDELPVEAAPADPLADGAPGLVKLDDSFDSPRWPVSQSATASYAYLNGRYSIDNQHAETMAISYQEDILADSAVSVEALGSGDPSAGFGLAARFQLNGGSISYYGLFVNGNAEFLLLKVLGGKEYVLRDWGPAPEHSAGEPWRLRLECRGSKIRVLINGQACATVSDSDIAAGGYALLGGPGAAASFDNFSLRGQR